MKYKTMYNNLYWKIVIEIRKLIIQRVKFRKELNCESWLQLPF